MAFHTLDDSLDLGTFGLSNKWLLGHDLRDELIHIGLFGEVKQIDTLGFHLTIATHVF